MGIKEIALRKFQKELNAGTAALVLLAVLERAGEPMYGYQIAKRLEAEREDVPIKQGAMYPVLRALEGSGFLESRVEPSVSGPPRKYYRITEEGREALVEWSEIWKRTRLFVESNLRGKSDV